MPNDATGHAIVPASPPVEVLYEDPLMVLPRFSHDDMVDAFAYALGAAGANVRDRARRLFVDAGAYRMTSWESDVARADADVIEGEVLP